MAVVIVVATVAGFYGFNNYYGVMKNPVVGPGMRAITYESWAQQAMQALLRGEVLDSVLLVPYASPESIVTLACYTRRGDIYILKEWTAGTLVPATDIVAFAGPMSRDMDAVYGMYQDGVCLWVPLDDPRLACGKAEEVAPSATDSPARP